MDSPAPWNMEQRGRMDRGVGVWLTHWLVIVEKRNKADLINMGRSGSGPGTRAREGSRMAARSLAWEPENTAEHTFALTFS